MSRSSASSSSRHRCRAQEIVTCRSEEVEKIFVNVKNIWTDHAADDAKHDGSQPQEHKLCVGPALNIKLQNMEFQLYNYISYLLKDMFFGRSNVALPCFGDRSPPWARALPESPCHSGTGGCKQTWVKIFVNFEKYLVKEGGSEGNNFSLGTNC